MTVDQPQSRETYGCIDVLIVVCFQLDWRRHWPQVLSQMQQTSPPHGVGVNSCSTATGRAPAAANRVNNRGGIRQLGRAMGLKWGQDATDMELSGQVYLMS